MSMWSLGCLLLLQVQDSVALSPSPAPLTASSDQSPRAGDKDSMLTLVDPGAW